MIITRKIDLPQTIKGFVIPDCNGDFNIYVNENHCEAQQHKTFEHELSHINNGDLDLPKDAHVIEDSTIILSGIVDKYKYDLI